MEREIEWQHDLPYNQAAGLCLNGMIRAARERQLSEMEQWFEVLRTSREYVTEARAKINYGCALVAALATIAHSHCSRMKFGPVYELSREAWAVCDEITGASEAQISQARWCVLRVLSMAKAQDPEADLGCVLAPEATAYALEGYGRVTLMREKTNKVRMESLLWSAVTVASVLSRAQSKMLRPFLGWANRVHKAVTKTRPLVPEPGYCMTLAGEQVRGLWYWQFEMNKLWACHLRGEHGMLTENAANRCYEHLCGEHLAADGRYGADYREFIKLFHRKAMAVARRSAA